MLAEIRSNGDKPYLSSGATRFAAINIQKMYGANLSHANLTDANLNQTKLAGADLTQTNLNAAQDSVLIQGRAGTRTRS